MKIKYGKATYTVFLYQKKKKKKKSFSIVRDVLNSVVDQVVIKGSRVNN